MLAVSLRKSTPILLDKYTGMPTYTLLMILRLRTNASAKRVIVEISTIADPKILDFYNSRKIFYNRTKNVDL